MYHLLVTANTGAWDLTAYEYPRNRFLESTSNWLLEKYVHLTPERIEKLKSYPALFTYEDQSQLARVGYIRHATLAAADPELFEALDGLTWRSKLLSLLLQSEDP